MDDPLTFSVLQPLLFNVLEFYNNFIEVVQYLGFTIFFTGNILSAYFTLQLHHRNKVFFIRLQMFFGSCIILGSLVIKLWKNCSILQ